MSTRPSHRVPQSGTLHLARLEHHVAVGKDDRRTRRGCSARAPPARPDTGAAGTGSRAGTARRAAAAGRPGARDGSAAARRDSPHSRARRAAPRRSPSSGRGSPRPTSRCRWADRSSLHRIVVEQRVVDVEQEHDLRRAASCRPVYANEEAAGSSLPRPRIASSTCRRCSALSARCSRVRPGRRSWRGGSRPGCRRSARSAASGSKPVWFTAQLWHS